MSFSTQGTPKSSSSPPSPSSEEPFPSESTSESTSFPGSDISGSGSSSVECSCLGDSDYTEGGGEGGYTRDWRTPWSPADSITVPGSVGGSISESITVDVCSIGSLSFSVRMDPDDGLGSAGISVSGFGTAGASLSRGNVSNFPTTTTMTINFPNGPTGQGSLTLNGSIRITDENGTRNEEVGESIAFDASADCAYTVSASAGCYTSPGSNTDFVLKVDGNS